MNKQRETNKVVTVSICFSILLLAIPAQIFLATPVKAADLDIIFDGSVHLDDGTFTWYDSYSGDPYVVANLTPHGALEAAAIDAGFDYGGSWKGFKSTAVIDWIEGYYYNDTLDPKWTWNYQLNGVYQDYFSDTTGVSNNPISDGDYIEFYYGPDQETPENATAVVRIKVNPKDILFDGSVQLDGGNFTWYDDSSVSHMVANLTPHGALEAASIEAGFDYGGSWKGTKNTALIDWIDEYEYNDTVTPKLTWNYQLNGVYQNYYSDTTGVSNNPITDNDYIEFYYGPDQETTENATAFVRITVNPTPTLGDWDLDLIGATTITVSKEEFEDGVDCGHYASWTDPSTDEFWEGMPLWYLVGYVDDDVQHGSGAFNDSLAAEGYTVKVTSSDGWSAELDSADIARDDGYIVANKLNGSELPLNTSSEKPCWPLHLKGPSVFGGQQVGGIESIELIGLPEPPEGWELQLLGEVGDVITQVEFEEAVSCHGVTYDDGTDVWEGVPLWYLCGAVDDLETASHWTFNDALASGNYTVTVIAADGYNKSFTSSVIARNDNYIVANSKNGEPLEYLFPLKLVGSEVFGGNKVGNISEILLMEFLTPPPAPGSYNLNLTGKITDVISQAEYEAAANPSCHGVTWIDGANTWEGVPLWFFCGWVDDRIPHGPDGFNEPLAAAGYTITVKAGDGYQKQFSSGDVAHSDYGYIVADTLNGTALSKEGDHPPWPLRLVGTEVSGGLRVGNITDIILSEFEEPSELPTVHVIKYVSPTNLTVLNETTVTYEWMEVNLPVIGDGTTAYKFEGIDFSGDHWDQNETYPGGFKIDRVVKGTPVRALCDLVGGMGPGTEIYLVASDGYETALGYKNIYTEALTTEQQERQGEAFLAWWASDQGYVPAYSNGIRLFFTASDDDHVFGLWDMHECMDEKYWHYFWQAGIQYPSCAGLSAKYVDTIKIYAEPEPDWELELEGTIDDTLSKSYFEQAIACAMGGHAAEYTDSKGRTWEGIPLWYLCGWVDDENAHSTDAYNDALAAQGYNITVYAIDGYNATIDSRLTIRNENYIVANSLNGSHISADDDNWPLRLVGANVSGGLQVRAIVKIALDVPKATVYFDPEDIRVPAYCNTTTVGVWVNPEVAMGSGQLTFNYTFCCANVTDFAPNLTNFDGVMYPGSLCTAVLTPCQVGIGFSTTAPGGLGPGPVHIGDLTFHCCHESQEYCETDIEWIPGYPDSYVESAANGEIAPVKYQDGVFRCNIPDLVITSVMGKEVDATNYTVNYTIKNVGAAIAAAGHVTSLTVDGIEVETKAVPDALAPGEEREYTFDSVIARNTSNPYDMIEVCADCEDAVIELDEENNCKDGRYPAEVVVSVIPAETIVQPQDQFDVKIHIDPRGQEILGIQYTLTYDTSVLRAETQTKGPFLGSGTLIVVNKIDQANGIVQYAETRTGETGVTAAGNVSTIHFIAIGERADTSALTLSDVIVVDVNKEETLIKLEDGLVEITDNQPPVPIGQSKFFINNVAKKYPSTAILCSCSYDPDWPNKGGNITYIRWAFGDGQYGTSEGLPVDNCTCKEHKYESWLWNTTTEGYDDFTVLLTVTDDGCPEATESTEFPITVYIAGDANGDGEVNIIDAVWVGKHWRDFCPATDYCEDCTGYLWFAEQDEHWAQKDGADLNNDCEINILDAVVIGANWRHVAWE